MNATSCSQLSTRKIFRGIRNPRQIGTRIISFTTTVVALEKIRITTTVRPNQIAGKTYSRSNSDNHYHHHFDMCSCENEFTKKK